VFGTVSVTVTGIRIFPITEHSTAHRAGHSSRECLVFDVQQGSELPNCKLTSLVESVPPCSTNASYNSCVSQQVACNHLPPQSKSTHRVTINGNQLHALPMLHIIHVSHSKLHATIFPLSPSQLIE
jgi:hypothetical protein